MTAPDSSPGPVAHLSGPPWTPLFDVLSVGVATVAMEGHWLRVNPALARMFACEADALAGRHFAEFTHPEDRDLHVFAQHDLDSGRLPSMHLEKRYVRADGSVFWAAVSVTLVRDGSGRAIGRLTEVRDVSPRKQAEDVLRARAEEQRALAAWNAALLDDMRECLERARTREPLVPVCSWCRRLRVDASTWLQLEEYLREHLATDVTHGICPTCAADVDRRGTPPGDGFVGPGE